MIDIETLGTRSNSVVVSIGACMFNSEGVYDHTHFYSRLALQEQTAHGFEMDVDTVSWWMTQSSKARKVFSTGEIAEPVRPTLLNLMWWLDRHAPLDGVWGNGPDFDNVIVANLMRAYDVEPWSYRLNRCYRTLRAACPSQGVERVGELHNALDDAVTQATHASKLMRELGWS
tara:strand:+ start:2018 stop:2536 length:519 start_codon:yes stop_codon:yes gene_type:complete